MTFEFIRNFGSPACNQMVVSYCHLLVFGNQQKIQRTSLKEGCEDICLHVR